MKVKLKLSETDFAGVLHRIDDEYWFAILYCAYSAVYDNIVLAV